MDELELTQFNHQLPFNLMAEVCSVILDTGWTETPEEYIRQYYGKSFSQLTVCEAEMIVRNLKDKSGCLFEGNPKDLELNNEKDQNATCD